MPRIRSIKPQHCSDKNLPTICLQAHLLWVLSWCFSDDDGVIENDPLLLKSQIFPRRTDIRVEQVQQWIDQLVKARYVIPFEYENGGYLLHRTFKVHQKIDRPQPSKIPSEVIRRLLDECSTNDLPCIGEESIGKERKRKPPSARDDSNNFLFITEIFSSDFIAIWQKWKDYKAAEFKFKFKSETSEKASFTELVNLSGKKEPQAIAIIEQSIANGWKGFFELKTDSSKKKEIPAQPKSALPKFAQELNFLYGYFLEGKVNIEAMDDSQYEFLKKSGIKLDKEQLEVVAKSAREYATEQNFKNLSEDAWKSLQRRFAIIEHFKNLKQQGHVTVFRME